MRTHMNIQTILTFLNIGVVLIYNLYQIISNGLMVATVV